LQRGIINKLTPAGYFAGVMVKAQQTLQAEGTEVSVSVGDGLVAARELSKLLAHSDETDQMARIMAQQNKIIEAFRLIPDQWQAVVLNRLEGKDAPAPGGPRLALVEATPADDEGFEPFGEDLEDDDDD
jgi:hypothetical protein